MVVSCRNSEKIELPFLTHWPSHLHIAHFGIIYASGIWLFLPIPATLWVVAMFAVSQLFFRCKQLCDSIWGAVVAHSGFNFAMMYLIFFQL